MKDAIATLGLLLLAAVAIPLCLAIEAVEALTGHDEPARFKPTAFH
jgi:hypothetical protein